MRTLLKNSSLIGISLVVALILCEIALQIANYPPRPTEDGAKRTKLESPIYIEDIHTGFRPASYLNRKMTQTEFSITIKTNERGMRDDSISPKSRKRILLLGDSYTFGIGVESDESFATLLEKLSGAEVINAGVGGWEIIHQVQFLRNHTLDLAPDEIFYVLFLGNDLTRNQNWVLENNRLIADSGTPLIRKNNPSKLYQLLYKVAWDIKLRQANKQNEVSNSNRSEWQPYFDYVALLEKEPTPKTISMYQTSFDLLRELNALSQKQNSKLNLILLPYRTMVEPDSAKKFATNIPDFFLRYDLALPARKISRWAEEEKVSVLDLTPVLNRHYQDTGEKLFYTLDGHLNPKGHKVVAQSIYRHFLSKGQTAVP